MFYYDLFKIAILAKKLIYENINTNLLFNYFAFSLFDAGARACA
jgi:hypothetical protein